jgi:hypothetical protein
MILILIILTRITRIIPTTVIPPLHNQFPQIIGLMVHEILAEMNITTLQMTILFVVYPRWYFLWLSMR